MGRTRGVCEYCGMAVKEELTEAESSSNAKNREFLDAIDTAVHCISTADYSSAIKYAKKAEDLLSNDPAPHMVLFVSYLDSDFKKARSANSIANSMRGQKESIAITDSQYQNMMAMFANNYLEERVKDLRRSFQAIRKMGPDDIENIRSYEHRKRLEDYYGIPELKETMENVAEQCIGHCESELRLTGQADPTSWESIRKAHDRNLFLVVSSVFLDPGLAPRGISYAERYDGAINLKWEPMAKNGQIDADKARLKMFRSESRACLDWLRDL